jgi:hypothetical protein
LILIATVRGDGVANRAAESNVAIKAREDLSEPILK